MSQIDVLKCVLANRLRDAERLNFLIRNCSTKAGKRRQAWKLMTLIAGSVQLYHSYITVARSKANGVIYAKAAHRIEEGTAVMINENGLLEKASGNRVTAVVQEMNITGNDGIKVQIL